MKNIPENKDYKKFKKQRKKAHKSSRKSVKREKKEGVRHFNGKKFTRVPGSPFNYRKTAETIAKKEKKAGAKATRIIKTKKKGNTYYNVFSR